MNSEQKDILKAYLGLVEKCSPMELSGVNNTIGNKHQSLSESEYENLAYETKNLIKTLVNNGISKDEIKNLLQQMPDYTILSDRFEDIYTEAVNESN